MPPGVRLVSGPELELLNDGQFEEAALNGTIFGRITPQQKERLVSALRRRGRYVAMIGDGVNDVLSLKQSNLAIAMQSGSQAARSVADIILLGDQFAVLPRAVEEGQRILNGMQDILKLYLARLLTIALLIISALVIGEFPLALRQGSAVVLFSVGIPTILLAFWARPGPVSKGNMIQRLFHFVIPPVLATSMIGLVLFSGTLLLLFNQVAGTASPPLEQVLQIYEAVMPTAQTVLTTFLVFCGLFLVIFCEPPSLWWTGGDRLSPDRRPMILACILMALFIVVLVVPPLSAIFALSTMSLQDASLVALALLILLPTVRWLWRINFLGRFLSVDLQSHAA